MRGRNNINNDVMCQEKKGKERERGPLIRRFQKSRLQTQARGIKKKTSPLTKTKIVRVDCVCKFRQREGGGGGNCRGEDKAAAEARKKRGWTKV